MKRIVINMLGNRAILSGQRRIQHQLNVFKELPRQRSIRQTVQVRLAPVPFAIFFALQARKVAVEKHFWRNGHHEILRHVLLRRKDTTN